MNARNRLYGRPTLSTGIVTLFGLSAKLAVVGGLGTLAFSIVSTIVRLGVA